MNWKNELVFGSESATERPNQSKDHAKSLQLEQNHIHEELKGTKS